MQFLWSKNLGISSQFFLVICRTFFMVVRKRQLSINDMFVSSMRYCTITCVTFQLYRPIAKSFSTGIFLLRWLKWKVVSRLLVSSTWDAYQMKWWIDLLLSIFCKIYILKLLAWAWKKLVPLKYTNPLFQHEIILLTLCQ